MGEENMDTLAMFREMERAGFTEDQANALTRVVSSAVAHNGVTREDRLIEMASLKEDVISATKSANAEVRSDIAKEMVSLKEDVAKVRSDLAKELNLLTRWVAGTILGAMGAFVVIISIVVKL